MQEDDASTNEICRKLVEDYRQEIERLKQADDRHGTVSLQLSFIVNALRQLCKDQDFVDVLHAEGLDTMPKRLADRIWHGAGHPA